VLNWREGHIRYGAAYRPQAYSAGHWALYAMRVQAGETGRGDSQIPWGCANSVHTDRENSVACNQVTIKPVVVKRPKVRFNRANRVKTQKVSGSHWSQSEQ
jgi:hypothetical protein